MWGAGPCPESHGWEKGKPLRGKGCSDPSMDLTQNGARVAIHFVGGGVGGLPKPSPDPGPVQVDMPPSQDLGGPHSDAVA